MDPRVSRDEVNSASPRRRNRRKTSRSRAKTRKHSLTSARAVFTVLELKRAANTFPIACKTCKTRRFPSNFLRLRHNLLQRDYPRERNAEKCIPNEAMKGRGWGGGRKHFDLQETSRSRIKLENKRSFTITFVI